LNHHPDVDPVLQKDFIEVINTMAEVFPNINGKARIKYYFDAVKDTPLKCLRDISKSFLMSSKYMPLPNDFTDAVGEWKKKNNFYKFNPDEPVPIDCKKCGDLGVLVMKKHEGEFVSLVNCNCQNSIFKDLKVPKWSNDLIGGFYSEVCPLDWFKPKKVLDFNLENSEIKNLMINWKKQKQRAEKYWSDLGYKGDVKL
jgi:hypothetical protein